LATTKALAYFSKVESVQSQVLSHRAQVIIWMMMQIAKELVCCGRRCLFADWRPFQIKIHLAAKIFLRVKKRDHFSILF